MIIGIDVGGTHTDGVLLDGSRIRKKAKVETRRDDLFSSISEALNRLIQEEDRSKIKRVILSTTLSTNAIVGGKTSRTGVLVSAGPGIDPNSYKCGDSFFVVKGSLDHRGREMAPLDRSEIEKRSSEMKALGIKNLAVVSKFSPRNPSHENQMEKTAKPFFGKVFKGHNVSGRMNFPRRINTALLNGMVYDEHKLFFESVMQSFKDMGLDCGIYILKADGGTMPVLESIEFPAQTIFSGPSASIMGAIPHAGDEDTIVLDIGGTTTDIAVLIRRSPVLANEGIEIDQGETRMKTRMKTLIRALETKSMGIGGDSFVRVENGEIKIGPERKDKAMAFGGKYPTITDAFACLGKIASADVESSRKGISKIAELLSVSLEDACVEIVKKASSNIKDAVFKLVEEINNKPVYTLHEFFEGYEIKPESIKILGAPAEAFAQYIERSSGIKTEAVPDYEVANAKGAAMARPTSSVTFFADTAMQKTYAPEENYEEDIPASYEPEDALKKAKELLIAKALKMGLDDNEPEIEVVENLSFNMVRGYRSSGKNIRLVLQLKPGLAEDL